MSDVGTDHSALPRLHGAWLTALTGIADPPSEPKATCGDCVMCSGVRRSGTRVRFSPDLKCCTYIPHLANFVAGRALAGPGRRSVLDRMGRRAGATPLGLGLSRADLGRLVGAQAHFGRADVVRCPHFDERTQGCAIWEARNAVCSTWFCRHERGAVSQRFWHAVRDLLIAVENEVAQRCLRAGDLPDEQVSAVLDHRAAVREAVGRANSGQASDGADGPGDADGLDGADDGSPEWYARMWGDWQGREEQWFERCAESVSELDLAALAVTSDDVRRLAEDVAARADDLRRRGLPDRLEFLPSPGTEATTELLRLIGYSPFDPLILPADLEPSLWRLDGRPLAQVQAEIKHEHGIELGEELLVRLHDFALALAVEAGPGDDEPAGGVLSLGGAPDGAVRLPAGPNRRLDLDGGEIVIP